MRRGEGTSHGFVAREWESMGDLQATIEEERGGEVVLAQVRTQRQVQLPIIPYECHVHSCYRISAAEDCSVFIREFGTLCMAALSPNSRGMAKGKHS